MNPLSSTPRLYSQRELHQPAKPVDPKPVKIAPVNPYQVALYKCGEALV